MTDWKRVKIDYENGMSYADMAQKYNQKANTIKGRKQREKWERKEIDITEPKKVFDIESLEYKKGFSPREIFKRYTGFSPCHLKERGLENWLLDVEFVARGIGVKRKVTIKYSKTGEILNITSTNILPTEKDRLLAEGVLERWKKASQSEAQRIKTIVENGYPTPTYPEEC